MQRKTKEEKEMQGTYEASREEIEPVKFKEADVIPYAPEGWPPKAQKLWRDRCEDLKQAGYMMKAALPHLDSYVWACYQASVGRRKLNEIGDEALITKEGKAWRAVIDEANKIIERFGAKFGFTPLDAMKIPKVVKEKGTTMNLLK